MPGDTARSLLRFITCGSVDDGKSTLIGRLIYESDLIMSDTLAALARDSRKHGTTGEEALDLALLVDGLEAEREGGITIDVAYRFFSTERRAFIVADTPGHQQYTRNMATGASTCDLAVILVDARKGVLTQTRRHTYICALLGIRHVVLAVNKIDLVDYAREPFDRIVSDWTAFAAPLGFRSAMPIPVSALRGDNIVERSGNMAWYSGPALLDHLSDVDVESDERAKPFRFPVQWINRPHQDFRGFAGTVASGQVAVGDALAVASSGARSRVSRILGPGGDVPNAGPGDAVTLCLADEIDIIRGDILVPENGAPPVSDQFAAHILWMDEQPMLPGRQYSMRHGNSWLTASVTAIRHRVDINTLEEHAARRLELNEIAVCNMSVTKRILAEPYADNRATGAFILVDRYTNRTVGAGMIDFSLHRATNIRRENFSVDKTARSALLGQTPKVLWFTGLSGAGKSTIAGIVEQRLAAEGRLTYTLDGDNLRHGLNRDLGFTDADRVENIRRVGEVAKLLVDAGLIVLCSFISPFRAERQAVRELLGPGEFVEVFVDTPLAECERRDPKGLYAKAQRGEIANFTGVSSPYEKPDAPELRLEGGSRPADALADEVMRFLER